MCSSDLSAERVPFLRRAAAAVAPGGVLVVVGHDRDNIEHYRGLLAGKLLATARPGGLIVVKVLPPSRLSIIICFSCGPLPSPSWAEGTPRAAGRGATCWRWAYRRRSHGNGKKAVRGMCACRWREQVNGCVAWGVIEGDGHGHYLTRYWPRPLTRGSVTE